MARPFVFTSESVTEGHPDKLADQISDAVLDAHLTQDPHARVACETLLKTNLIVLAGEVRSRAHIDAPKLAKQVVRDAGYDDAALGFSLERCRVIDQLDAQSADIAMGVDEATGHEQGAGDQGMMFGFACDETPELMPAPIMWAHHFARALAEARQAHPGCGVRPDGKVQVTVGYDNNRPTHIDTLLISTQHEERLSDCDLEAFLRAEVVEPTLARFRVGVGERPPALQRLLINPTGRFVVGGPQSDAGLTGRKIIVDSYGGAGRHGGGAFSGKDPSKVDRSAAYFGRYIAKNIVAAGLAARCEVQLAYAIGVAKPVSLFVQTFGTAACDEAVLEAAAGELFDARPAEIVRRLSLQEPRFRITATYGHFGRSAEEASWEAIDAVEALRERCGGTLGASLARGGSARFARFDRPS